MVNSTVHMDISFVLNDTISIGPWSSLIVDPSTKLIIDSAANVIQYGTFVTNKGGIVINLGRIDPQSGSDLIENYGTFVNQGAIVSGNPGPMQWVDSGYTLNNYDSFTNDGYIVIVGASLTNNAGAHFANNNYIISGSSSITSSGKMTNAGRLSDDDIYDFGASGFRFLPGNMLNNTGYLGVGGSLDISVGSNVVNNGTIESEYGQYGQSACCLINGGTLYNEIGGSIRLHNTGSVVNNGTTINYGIITRDVNDAFPSNWSFTNYPYGLIDNFGQITLDSGPFESTLYNNGTINQRCNGVIQLLGETTTFAGNPINQIPCNTATALTPNKDSTIVQSANATNFGANDTLIIGSGAHKRTLVSFDLCHHMKQSRYQMQCFDYT